jgi:hypothetical protein
VGRNLNGDRERYVSCKDFWQLINGQDLGSEAQIGHCLMRFDSSVDLGANKSGVCSKRQCPWNRSLNSSVESIDDGGPVPAVFQVETNMGPEIFSRAAEHERLDSDYWPISYQQTIFRDFDGFDGGFGGGGCGGESATQEYTLNDANDHQQKGKKRQEGVGNFQSPTKKYTVLGSLFGAFLGLIICLPLGIFGGLRMLGGHYWLGSGCLSLSFVLALSSTIGLLFDFDLWTIWGLL